MTEFQHVNKMPLVSHRPLVSRLPLIVNLPLLATVFMIAVRLTGTARLLACRYPKLGKPRQHSVA